MKRFHRPRVRIEILNAHSLAEGFYITGTATFLWDNDVVTRDWYCVAEPTPFEGGLKFNIHRTPSTGRDPVGDNIHFIARNHQANVAIRGEILIRLFYASHLMRIDGRRVFPLQQSGATA